MEKYLKSYLENNIILEYSDSDKDYEVSIYNDVSEHDQKSLIDVLYDHDEITKEFLIDRMQQLVDQRSTLMSSEKKYEMGLVPSHDNQTGEVVWIKNT